MQKRNSMRRMLCVLVCLLPVLLLAGCSVEKTDKTKLKDLEYTIVEKDEIPDEMKAEIEKRKAEPFKITYGDGASLYIGQGYGKRETSGYSVEIKACYETSNSIFIHTNLIGPGNDEEISEKATYPYVVVKMPWSEKTVLYK